jgi:partner of Y14 and mago
MSTASKSGIQTSSDGSSFIPASQRADGSTRKEIRVRPGYRPPEDVETYKNRSAESWKNRGKAGVPGADPAPTSADDQVKSKNAKRREAARRKATSEANPDSELSSALQESHLDEGDKIKADWRDPNKLATNPNPAAEEDAERQKRVRNALKKLKAVRELKEKRSSGEKLSHDQLLKIGKESELVRDLRKLGYEGPELDADPSAPNGEQQCTSENG